MNYLSNTCFLLFVKITSLFFRYSKKKQLKTILVLAIAIVSGIAILAAVIVLGGMYQQELYQEYLENTQDNQNTRELNNPNFPSIEILP